MIFIMGITTKQKKLDFYQNWICPRCGKYGRLEVYMEYMCLSLFFIPIIKWNKKYYVHSSCCGSVYSIDKELGNRIARGEGISLREEDLQPVQTGHVYYGRRCRRCGYETYEDFNYCPKCGEPFND